MIILVLLAGCTQLRIQQPLITSAEDWTMSGSDIGRTNVARGSSLHLPLSQVWAVETTAGFGASVASVSDHRLFVSNLRGDLQLFDVATGAGIGKMDFGASIIGTPAVERGIVYVALAGTEESLLAYDLQNAKVLWHSRLGDIESSPLLMDDHIYVTTAKGELVCVKAGDGERVWTFTPNEKRGPATHSSPEAIPRPQT